MEAVDKTSLFPRIGKAKDVIALLEKIDPGASERANTKLALAGTVKLHGAHNDIIIDAADNIRLQSRNVLDLQIAKSDAYGFTTFMQRLTPALLDLKKQYHARFTLLHPDTAIDPAQPLIIAGEWIGAGVQKGVAIAAMSRRFVILAVSINGAWLPDEEYRDLANDEAGIHNISRGGFYRESLDLADIEGSMERIQAVTDRVELACPFAKSFGVEGAGEGIVWKVRERAENAEFWFKTKGPKFSPKKKPEEFDAALVASLADVEVRIAEMARRFVTDRRLEQGMEYLEELGVTGKKKLAKFTGWVAQDCLVEERIDIREAGVDEAALKTAIARLAGDLYIERMKGG